MFFVESVLDTSLRSITNSDKGMKPFIPLRAPSSSLFSYKIVFGAFLLHTLDPTPPAMHSIPLPPFSEPVQGLACVHNLLAWTLPGYGMKLWGEFISAEDQMEVFRECQNSKALLPSFFILLAVVVCPHLLSLVAGYC